jgi:hypothetical protein
MIKEFLGMAALVAALLFVGNLDRQDAERDESTYCEMVAIWENDPRPEIDRAGWPPYNSAINCEG